MENFTSVRVREIKIGNYHKYYSKMALLLWKNNTRNNTRRPCLPLTCTALRPLSWFVARQSAPLLFLGLGALFVLFTYCFVWTITNNLIIHWTHDLFSDGPKVEIECSKSAPVTSWRSKLKYENAHHFLLFSSQSFIWKCQKAWWPKKENSKEDEQISAGLS